MYNTHLHGPVQLCLYPHSYMCTLITYICHVYLHYIYTQLWRCQLANSSLDPFCDEAIALTQGLCVLLRYLTYTTKSTNIAYEHIASIYGEKKPIPPDLIMPIKAVLEQFIKRVEHWIDPNIQSVYELELWVHHWILGHVPPPRCQYCAGEDMQCMEVANRHGKYCARFHFCQARIEVCDQPRAGENVYCTRHKCHYKGRVSCANERVLATSYCEAHVCIGCLHTRVTTGTSAGTVNSIEGPHACKLHTCQYTEGNKKCASMALLPYKYCLDHTCDTCLHLNDPARYNKPLQPRSKSCINHKCFVKECGNKRYEESIYCTAHVCALCVATSFKEQSGDLQVIDSALPASGLCVDHRCSHDDECNQARCESSPYCIQHTCWVCRRDNISPPMGPVTDDSIPRNVCGSHLLCSHTFASGGMCHLIAEADSPYCTAHVNGEAPEAESESDDEEEKEADIYRAVPVKASCSGKNAKGRPCGSKDKLQYYGDRIFCTHHKLQATTVIKVQKQSSKPKIVIVKPEQTESEKIYEQLLREVVTNLEGTANIIGGTIQGLRQYDKQLIEHLRSHTHIKQCQWTESPCHVLVCDSDFCPLHLAYLTNLTSSDHDFEVAAACLPTDIPNEATEQAPATDAKIMDVTSQIINSNTITKTVVVPPTDTALDAVDLADLPDLADTNMAVKEAVVGLDGDELDMEFAYDGAGDVEEEAEENDELKRLRDINDNDDGSANGDQSDEDSVHGEQKELKYSYDKVSVEDEKVAMQLIQAWSWDMPLEARWKSASYFLRCISALVSKLRVDSDDHVVAARVDRNQAGIVLPVFSVSAIYLQRSYMYV